jgi:phosphocarrier,  HPr family
MYCKLWRYGVYFEKYLKEDEEGKMSRKEVVISDVSEEHDNPIAELVQVACRFDSEITLESDNRRINAKSIMGIMAFNPSKGMKVNIVAEGNDEREALVAMEKFLVCE